MIEIENLKIEDNTINCSKCGEKHIKQTSNCCWISCSCGAEICGGCGSDNLCYMEMPEDDDEACYWCCKMCESCDMTGCGMCI